MLPAPIVYAWVILTDTSGSGEQGAYLRRMVVGLTSSFSVKCPVRSYHRPSVLGHIKLTLQYSSTGDVVSHKERIFGIRIELRIVLSKES